MSNIIWVGPEEHQERLRRAYLERLRTYESYCNPNWKYVTGPGRSGAITAAMLSHMFGLVFIPPKTIPEDLASGVTDVLIVDTTSSTGKTMRRLVSWYEKQLQKDETSQVKPVVGDMTVWPHSSGNRYKFWYERPYVKGQDCKIEPTDSISGYLQTFRDIGKAVESLAVVLRKVGAIPSICDVNWTSSPNNASMIRVTAYVHLTDKPALDLTVGVRGLLSFGGVDNFSRAVSLAQQKALDAVANAGVFGKATHDVRRTALHMLETIINQGITNK